jgi:hypothetical protein
MRGGRRDFADGGEGESDSGRGGPKSHQRFPARAFHPRRRKMKKRPPISDCDICRRLSSHVYADLTFDPVPENIARLVGASPAARLAEEIIECPLCGTFYSYVYACGFGENDITLRRVSPTEAGRAADVVSLKEDLASPHEDTRGYAAHCLVEHYLAEGSPEEAEALVNDGDEVVSSSAEAARKYYFSRRSLG